MFRCSVTILNTPVQSHKRPGCSSKTSGPLHKLLHHHNCSSACLGYLHSLTSFKSLPKCHLFHEVHSTFFFFFAILTTLDYSYVYVLSPLTRHNSRTLPILLNGCIPPPPAPAPEYCMAFCRHYMLGNRDPGRRKQVWKTEEQCQGDETEAGGHGRECPGTLAPSDPSFNVASGFSPPSASLVSPLQKAPRSHLSRQLRATGCEEM